MFYHVSKIQSANLFTVVMLIWIPNNYTQKNLCQLFTDFFFQNLTITFQLLRHIMTSYNYLSSSEYCKLKQGDGTQVRTETPFAS